MRRGPRSPRLSPRPKTVFALVALGLSVASAACSSGAECTEEPAYGGVGNDEVWLTLRDARSRATVGEDSPGLVVPTGGQVFAAEGAPPTFSWTSPLKIGGVAHSEQPVRAAGDRGWAASAAAAWRSLAAWIVPAAHAHLPPVSSDVYLVEVTVPGRQCPVAIVTSELSHSLEDKTWSALQDAAGVDLSLRITSAYLASGRIAEGPFRSEDVPFRVE